MVPIKSILNFGGFKGYELDGEVWKEVSLLKKNGAVCKKENNRFLWYLNGSPQESTPNTDTDFGFKGSLFRFQKRHLSRLLSLDRGLLAIDTGLGKTVEMSSLLQYLYFNGAKLPSLVIVPKSIIPNWVRELETHTNLTYGLTSRLKFKSKNDRLVEFNDAQVKIINYTQLRINKENIIDLKYETVIFDEANFIKNIKTDTAKQAYKLNAKRKYLLTATPIKNSPLEIYSLARALDCSQYLFGSYNEYLNTYAEMRQVPFSPVPISVGYRNLDMLKSKIKPFSIFESKNNPDIINEIGQSFKFEIKVLQIDIKPEQKKILDYISSEMERLLRQVGKSFNSSEELIPKELSEYREKMLAYYTIARMVGCSVKTYLSSNSELKIGFPPVDSVSLSPKISEIIRIINDETEQNEKVVIYTSFISFSKEIENSLNEAGINTLSASGADNYLSLIERFKSDNNIKALVITGIGKYGINLQNSQYLIFADMPFTYNEVEQLIGRVVRIGQGGIPIIYFLLSGIIDNKIYSSIMMKREYNRFDTTYSSFIDTANSAEHLPK